MKFIIEHLDDQTSEWTCLEYQHMQSHVGSGLILSGVQDPSIFPESLQPACRPPGFLDSLPKSRVLLLDPKAEKELSPEDALEFDYFLFGGILGDDPPRDRTGILRKQGFEGRHLGPVQMPTDHAVLFSQATCQGNVPVATIDSPEFSLGKGESVSIPMRFVINPLTKQPYLAPGLADLLRKQNDEAFEL